MKRGWQLWVALTVTLALAAMPAMAAGKGSTSGLNCTVSNAVPGIASDGNPDYSHGSTRSSVKCFLGAGGKNFDLVTYSTGRTLKFTFSSADSATATVAGLPDSFNAEVDAYGINYWGPYLNMEQGSTARVQMDLQFHWGGGSNTYELSYSCLAVTRINFTTWVLTSESDGSNQFAVPCLSSRATLSKVRRNSVQGFGEVNMPITIQFSPQQ